jgi:hypothetical protein
MRKRSSSNTLKDAADRLQICEIALFRAASDFVEPPYRSGFQAGLGSVLARIDDLDLEFDCVLTALDATLTAFTTFVHRN